MSVRFAFFSFIVAALLLYAACGGGPKTPAAGSPEWLYQAATEAFRLGEIEKAHQHLEKIEETASPYQARGAAWHVVMEIGLLLGNQELAEAYQKGWDLAGAQRSDFLREKQNVQRDARRHALHLAETYDHFVKTLSEKPVVLQMPFPKGSGAPVTDLDRVYKGMWPSAEQRAQIQEKVLNRGMVRGVSAAITSPDDAAGAQNALKGGRAEVPAAKFLLAAGESLWKTAPLFERKVLNEPDKIKFFQERALDAAKRAREMKPEEAVAAAAKKLQDQCEKALKAKKV